MKTQKEKFYIKNNILFSETQESIKIYKNFNSIYFENNSNVLKGNKHILKEFDNFEKKSIKEIKISGRIDNYKQVIEKVKKLPKTSFKKVKDDDYEFIEKTSQIEILTQIIDSINNTEIKDLRERVESYILHNKVLEKDKIESYLDFIKTEDNKIQIIDEKIKRLEDSKIKALNFKNLNSKKEIQNLINKKIKLEELLGQSAEKEEVEKQLEELQRKESKIKFKIEENKIDIKIIKTKINTLTDSIKLGKQKTIQAIPFILSLGFVYWTKYSDTKYIRNSLHLKLNKKHETELHLEKKLHKVQNEIENKKRESKKIFINISKKQEQINRDIENCEIDIKNQEKENKKLEKELERELKEISRIEREKQVFIDRKKEYEMILKEYNKNSLKKIQEEFSKLEKYRKENINKLKEIKKEILSQKITKKGEWVLET